MKRLDTVSEVLDRWSDDTAMFGYRCHRCQSENVSVDLEAPSDDVPIVSVTCEQCGYMEGVDY